MEFLITFAATLRSDTVMIVCTIILDPVLIAHSKFFNIV